MKAKVGAKAVVLRSQLADSLAATLPSFIFFNEGVISKVKSGRVEIRFNKEDRFWFDDTAIGCCTCAIGLLPCIVHMWSVA